MVQDVADFAACTGAKQCALRSLHISLVQANQRDHFLLTVCYICGALKGRNEMQQKYGRASLPSVILGFK